MDPRHPEKVLPRIKELVKQYEDLEKRISEATVSSDLGQLEREGSLVVQELCLVAPRLHEGLMNTSRNRRTELMSGIVEKRRSEALVEIAKQAEKISEQVSEIADTITEKEKKPAKKKPAKKGKK